MTPADADLLATIRARCPEAEAAMAAHVASTLARLVGRMQGLLASETDLDAFLSTLLTELVAWQLAHAEPWGADEPARQQAVGVLARAVVADQRAAMHEALLSVPRN